MKTSGLVYESDAVTSDRGEGLALEPWPCSLSQQACSVYTLLLLVLVLLVEAGEGLALDS